jgi:ElaB/YqjD/DUF883 family membrane-anchored ribosome-binding protein
MKLGRTSNRTPDDFASDLATLIDEGRALLSSVMDKQGKRAVSEGKGALQDAFDQVNDTLASIQSSATRAATQGAKQGARYARVADSYVRDNPWPVVASGIAIGVLATLWWNQRR